MSLRLLLDRSIDYSVYPREGERRGKERDKIEKEQDEEEAGREQDHYLHSLLNTIVNKSKVFTQSLPYDNFSSVIHCSSKNTILF